MRNDASPKAADSVAIGADNTIDASDCIVVGNRCSARHNGCVLIGNDLSSTEPGQAVIGLDSVNVVKIADQDWCGRFKSLLHELFEK